MREDFAATVVGLLDGRGCRGVIGGFGSGVAIGGRRRLGRVGWVDGGRTGVTVGGVVFGSVERNEQAIRGSVDAGVVCRADESHARAGFYGRGEWGADDLVCIDNNVDCGGLRGGGVRCSGGAIAQRVKIDSSGW